MIQNPILRGFHPDPSIVRAGDDYYIATSTFEWWPGIQISHSKDLAHWETLTYVTAPTAQDAFCPGTPATKTGLQSDTQDAVGIPNAVGTPNAAGTPDVVGALDLKGVGPSQGIWAPCLTRAEGKFWLLCTVVNSFYCNMYDTRNYLLTAEDIMGPWSAPVPLNNFGFDPSLFHDDDGRKYMVSMVTDHRVPKKYAGRIILQEYDAVAGRMMGPVREIYQGTRIFLEGPHIFKRDGWYYLFSADTGTGEGHGQTIQRARSVWGPYEMYRCEKAGRTTNDEAYSILTSRHHPDHPLQKAGHADLVQTQTGEWYMVHLCGRPLESRNPADAPRFAGERRYPLGRETAIQRVRWTDKGWPKLSNGTVLADVEVTAPALPECPFPEKPARDDFDAPRLDNEYQSLRIPMTEEHLSLTARPGWLRMYGREGLASLFRQSLIARRRSAFCFTALTCMEFEPDYFKQMAGLIVMYDTENYLYLHVSRDEDAGKCISILRAENKAYTYPAGYIPAPEHERIYFKVQVRREMLQFYWHAGEQTEYEPVGECFDCSFLSDEACTQGWFTGGMVGLCCQDLTGFGKYCDFDYFEYADED